ncbi:MAG: hypothetical protein ACP5FK_09700 [bacterium]
MVNLALEVNADVEVGIFDLAGRCLSKTRRTYLNSGAHCIQLSCSHLCIGGYIIRLQLNDDIYSKFILNI